MDKLNYFILCYNRGLNIPTLNMLHKYGIYDNVYLVVGDDDPKLNEISLIDCCKVLVFNKLDLINRVDAIGTYRYTMKICTYAREYVDLYAKANSLRYICILFDDIESVQLRYVEHNIVRSTKQFNLKKLFSWYIELLNCNNSIYMIGPPGSSFYIGCTVDTCNKIATHYGNILIYDINKPIGHYVANVLEDMTIVLYNSKVGHIGLFPFGLQVNCRPAMTTLDAYKGISESEYRQQWRIITLKKSDDKLIVPYSKFIPKIISSRYRKSENSYENSF